MSYADSEVSPTARDRWRCALSVYIVRRTQTHGLLGIFAVRDLESLALQIQNCAEPEECEFCEIDTGGIIWPATGGRKMPAEPGPMDDIIDEAEDQEDPDPLKLLAGAILTDSWQEAFYEEAHSWQRVPAITTADAEGV